MKSCFDVRHQFQLVSFFSKPQITHPTKDPKACTSYIQFSIELLLKVTIRVNVQYRNWTYLQHALQKFIVITNSTMFCKIISLET